MALVVAGLIASAFMARPVGSVKGTVDPREAGLNAFLFSGKDTVSVSVVSGTFQFFNVKPGNYDLLIEAAPPYQNGVRSGIRVADGQFTDAGEIRLLK